MKFKGLEYDRIEVGGVDFYFWGVGFYDLFFCMGGEELRKRYGMLWNLNVKSFKGLKNNIVK